MDVGILSSAGLRVRWLAMLGEREVVVTRRTQGKIKEMDGSMDTPLWSREILINRSNPIKR